MFTTPLHLNALTSVKPIAWAHGVDGVDTIYEFNVYPIHAKPHRGHSVYWFCCLQGAHYTPVYIGRAEDLHSRLVGHKRLAEAIRLGAAYLLVHSPSPWARINYLEAERRFIAHNNPVLNVHHRTQPQWLTEPMFSRLVSPF